MSLISFREVGMDAHALAPFSGDAVMAEKPLGAPSMSE